jgi:chaperonin GroES
METKTMDAKKIKPLQDRVLIKRIKAQTSKGGILLPDSAQEKPQIGEVIAVGEGKMSKEGKLLPLAVKVGDKVLFSSYAGTPIQMNISREPSSSESEHLILGEEDILAIVS